MEKEKVSHKKKKKLEIKTKAKFDRNDDSEIDAESNELFSSRQKISKKSENKGHSELTWEGSDKPKKPRLKWFAHDEGIKGLIEMRCKGINPVKTRTIELYGSNSATMSKDTACRIDSAISSIGSTEGKASGKGSSDFEKTGDNGD